jgi:hypothetical protein
MEGYVNACGNALGRDFDIFATDDFKSDELAFRATRGDGGTNDREHCRLNGVQNEWCAE